MGPPQADVALREALAMGCDDALLISDRAFGGADTWATSSTIAAALKKLDYDVIITGRQAIDGDTAQVGPQIAEHLGIPQVSYVQKMDVETVDTFLRSFFIKSYFFGSDKLVFCKISGIFIFSVLSEFASYRFCRRCSSNEFLLTVFKRQCPIDPSGFHRLYTMFNGNPFFIGSNDFFSVR